MSRHLFFTFKLKQAQLGVPHSGIQVELGLILQAGTCQSLNFAQNPRQSQSVQGTELNWGWGGAPHRKSVYREGGHRTYFLNRVPIGGGTPHILSEEGANRGGHRTSKQAPISHWICQKKMGWGWVGGWFHQNNATSWLHLASWYLPDFQLC